MSIKSKVFAAAAALTLVGGVGAAGALSAGAATPSCGHDCLDLFSREFGTHVHPNFVMDALQQGASLGQPVILFRTSNSDQAEDFTVAFQGNTSDFFAAGLVSSAVALHYGCTAGKFPGGNCYNPGDPTADPPIPPTGVFQDDPAFEAEYAPYGVDSGLCVGVALTAFQNEKVSLQPCGVSARTVWILDLNPPPPPPLVGPTLSNSAMAGNNGYVPLINGSDTNFSHPFVLTYPKNGFPTDVPRPQLMVQKLTGFSHGPGMPIGSVQDNQLWGADFGVLR
jgi:hypothetical protein